MGRTTPLGEHLAPAAVLILLLLFHGAMGWVWIHENQALQGTDEIDYFQVLQRFERAWPVDWSSPLHNLKTLTDSIEQTSYPPFPSILGTISLDWFGRSPVAPRLLSWFAFLVTLLLLFFMGREMGGVRTGILASAVFACFPLAMMHSRFYNIHMLNACMVTLAIWCLIKSDSLMSFLWMPLFGIALGLALLTERGTAPLYLVGPVAAYVITAGIHHGRKSADQLVRPAGLFLLAVAIALLLAGRFLYDYLMYQGEYIAGNVTNPFYEQRTDPFYYLGKLFRWFTGHPFGWLLWIGSVVLLLKKPYAKKALVVLAAGWVITGPLFSSDARLFFWALVVCVSLVLSDLKHRWVLVAWLLVPLVFFSAVATRSIDYMFASLPALALAIAAVVVQLAKWRIGRWIVVPLVGITIVFSLFQTVVISFPWQQGRAIYRAMPAFLRFAGGNEKFYPLPSHRSDTAEKIIDSMALGDSGLILYLPGERGLHEYPDHGDFYLPNSLTWAMELQVWMAFLHPGLNHILISDRIVGKQPWMEAKTDIVAWIPLPENETRLMKKIQQQERINPIMIITDDRAAEAVFSNIGNLPGPAVEVLRVIQGRRLLLTRPEIAGSRKEAP